MAISQSDHWTDLVVDRADELDAADLGPELVRALEDLERILGHLALEEQEVLGLAEQPDKVRVEVDAQAGHRRGRRAGLRVELLEQREVELLIRCRRNLRGRR